MLIGWDDYVPTEVGSHRIQERIFSISCLEMSVWLFKEEFLTLRMGQLYVPRDNSHYEGSLKTNIFVHFYLRGQKFSITIYCFLNTLREV